jgi:hypothetical protein
MNHVQVERKMRAKALAKQFMTHTVLTDMELKPTHQSGIIQRFNDPLLSACLDELLENPSCVIKAGVDLAGRLPQCLQCRI